MLLCIIAKCLFAKGKVENPKFQLLRILLVPPTVGKGMGLLDEIKGGKKKKKKGKRHKKKKAQAIDNFFIDININSHRVNQLLQSSAHSII